MYENNTPKIGLKLRNIKDVKGLFPWKFWRFSKSQTKCSCAWLAGQGNFALTLAAKIVSFFLFQYPLVNFFFSTKAVKQSENYYRTGYNF